jgi:hypothetical protein
MKIIGWGVVAVALLLPALAYSQRVLIGAKVGGQINNPYGYPGPSSSSLEERILFGPTTEVHVTHGMSVEFDALYSKSADFLSSCCAPLGLAETQVIGTYTARMHSWQLPVTLKWRLQLHHQAISLGAGFSARNIFSASQISGTQMVYPGGPTVPVDSRYSDSDWTYGPVFAAGISFRAGFVHLQPELRYVRWNDSPLQAGKLDSFQALIGISAGRGGANTRF